MNKWMMRGLQLLGYWVPFSFLAIYGDAEFHSMWLYLLMISGFGALCVWVARTKQYGMIVLGNIVSGLSSYLCVGLFAPERWGWYFKPLTAEMLVIVLTVVAFVVQCIVAANIATLGRIRK